MRPCLLPRHVLVCCLALAAGCAAPRAFGALGDEGFEHLEHDYRIAYADAGARTLMPEDWRLDNFRAGEGRSLGTPKEGPLYEYTAVLDADGDGDAEMRVRRARFDLLFRHRTTGASMWVRSVVAPEGLEERALRVIVRDYIDGLAGVTEASVAIERPMTPSRVRRLAANVVHEGPLEVAGLDGYTAIVDLVNLDQRELTSEAVWERSEIVVLRPGFHEALCETTFPVFLVVGYVSRPEDFASHQDAFHDLLGRLIVGGHAGREETPAEGEPGSVPSPAYRDPGTPPPVPPEAEASDEEPEAEAPDASEATPDENP